MSGGMGGASVSPDESRLLFIEPFYGGSHKQLVDLLRSEISGSVLFSLPAKKWHWRARTSALYFARAIPRSQHYSVLFASSVLNLAELVALRPDFLRLKKIIYFHENQLVYPVRERKDRDFQYGYNQIISCLVADEVVFNSSFNKDSFLGAMGSFLNLIPDHVPKGVEHSIQPKCHVLYFPICPPPSLLKCQEVGATGRGGPLHIVWPHRWEHDKDPETFFKALYIVCEEGLDFRLSVLGENFTDNLPIFDNAHAKLSKYVVHWGFLHDKDEYYAVLRDADIVVSTAKHEFFGVAMLEAVACGCYPVAPNNLVYPELFPGCCLYNTFAQLVKKLKNFCKHPHLLRDSKLNISIENYTWDHLKRDYVNVLCSSPSQPSPTSISSETFCMESMAADGAPLYSEVK